MKNDAKHPGHGKRERYIQPSILLGLLAKPSYGYELIQEMHQFGFIQGQAPPGMIYRHLRQLEEDGLVTSTWETEGSGPAKRMYAITEAGVEMLALWVEYMEGQMRRLADFSARYRNTTRGAPE